MDIKDLTLGEVAKIEELSGLPIAAIAEDDKPKGKLLAAVGFVIMRRTDPKFTLEQANKFTITEIQELMTSNEDVKK